MMAAKEDETVNKQRRKDFEKAQALAAEAAEIMDRIADEEQEYHDNMPEGLQAGDKGQAAETDATNMREWADALQEIADAGLEAE